MNREVYDEFVKDFGEPEEGTEEYRRFEHLMPLDPPDCFAWLFNEFISIYNECDTTVTPESIAGYSKLHEIRFTLFELDLLFRMKAWAADERMKLDRRE